MPTDTETDTSMHDTPDKQGQIEDFGDEFSIDDDDLLLGADSKNFNSKPTSLLGDLPLVFEEDDDISQLSEQDTATLEDTDIETDFEQVPVDTTLSGLDIIVGDYGSYETQFVERHAEAHISTDKLAREIEAYERSESTSSRALIYAIAGVAVLMAVLTTLALTLSPATSAKNSEPHGALNMEFGAGVSDTAGSDTKTVSTRETVATDAAVPSTNAETPSGTIILSMNAPHDVECSLPVLIMFTNGADQHYASVSVGESKQVSLPYGQWSVEATCSPICNDGTVLAMASGSVTISDAQPSCSMVMTLSTLSSTDEASLNNSMNKYIRNGLDSAYMSALVDKARAKYLQKEEIVTATAENTNASGSGESPANVNASASSGQGSSSTSNGSAAAEEVTKNTAAENSSTSAEDGSQKDESNTTPSGQ